MNNIYLIISVYNEAKYLPRLLSKLKQTLTSLPQIHKVIFVNDGSNDESRDILQEHLKKNHRYLLLNHKTNLGKGAAMDTGYKLAKKEKANGVIFMDADLQHDPFYLKIFVEKLKTNQAVFGYRMLGREAPWIRRIGNLIVVRVIRLLFNIKRRDVLCGFFALRKELFGNFQWESADYGVETEISTIIARRRIDFVEVKISTIYHQAYKGVNLFHAFLILLKIPFWYFRESHHLAFLTTLFLLVIYLPFAWKDVFSDRWLGPNLEPYPDTLYYLSPAWNLVRGNGFGMFFEGLEFKWITPPLYSLFVSIFFWLFKDVRSFFFLNLGFMLSSIYLFTRILWVKLSLPRMQKLLIIGLFGIILTTNFYFYVLPGMALAENPTLFFTLLGVYWLSLKPKKSLAYALAMLPAALMLVKLANLGIAMGLGLATLLWLGLKNKRTVWLAWFSGSLMAAGILGLFLWKSGILIPQRSTAIETPFSLSYFWNNLQFYVLSLLGKPTLFLWFRERLYHPFVGSGLAILSFLATFLPKYRSYAVSLLLIIIGQVVFMSLFYVGDFRYILAVVPMLYLVAALGYGAFTAGLKLRWHFVLITIIMLFYFCLPGAKIGEPNIITLRTQAVLNLKYAETPWNYLAVANFNQYFKNRPGSYLLTYLPPFYIDLYRTANYHFLPASQVQNFVNGPEGWLKKKGISQLTDHYDRLLRAGERVYISNSYVNNLGSWVLEYEQLKKWYNFNLVHKGCLESCNIYRITRK